MCNHFGRLQVDFKLTKNIINGEIKYWISKVFISPLFPNIDSRKDEKITQGRNL